jgi:hypothetical protein
MRARSRVANSSASLRNASAASMRLAAGRSAAACSRGMNPSWAELVSPQGRRRPGAVADGLIEHSVKPSMAQNWRNYAAYYVIPYIGQRGLQEIDGAVCDALYAKLLADGRVKARPRKRPGARAVHARRLAADGRALPCRPYSYDTVWCYRTHAEDDPAVGRLIEPRKLGRRAAEDAAEATRRKLSPGLEAKTVAAAGRPEIGLHDMRHYATSRLAAMRRSTGRR